MKVTSVLGIVASVIAGLFMLGSPIALLGVAAMMIGSLLSWVGGLMIYGFGQLIENTDMLEILVSQKRTNKQPTIVETNELPDL